MRKEDNDWEIDKKQFEGHKVEINGSTYSVGDDTACLAHAILLLVDAVNDKNCSRS